MSSQSSAAGGSSFTKLADTLKRFLKLESTSGIFLLATLVVALAWANSPWAETYFIILGWPGGAADAHFASIHQWINDGLMAVFFFVVGAEIKREFISGELASFKQAALPVVAAVGGMVVPALIYVALNAGRPGASGWGVPMATDIAFALGILALLGKRVPIPLKVFLMALAIIDDLGAILVIALFYTESLSWAWLGAAAAVFGILFAMGRLRIDQPAAYAVFAILLWYALLHSGIHGTIAGVMAAWTVPTGSVKSVSGHKIGSVLNRMEGVLHPWSAYIILPLFALANAGVRIDTGLLGTFGSRVSLGIFLGLLVGKPLGILLASWAAIALGSSPLSGGVGLRHLLGAGMLGGIGFTMSIFISGLAFGDGPLLDTAKLAVLLASLASGILGWVYLRLSLKESHQAGNLGSRGNASSATSGSGP